MNAVQDAQSMARVQRTFYVDENLSKLLDAHLRRSGSTLTRALSAALLKYLLEKPTGPESYWMELAVGLDAGDITLDEVVSDRYDWALAELNALFNFELEGQNRTDQQSTEPRILGEASVGEHALLLAKSMLRDWEALDNSIGDDPVATIAKFWSDRERQRSKPKTSDS